MQLPPEIWIDILLRLRARDVVMGAGVADKRLHRLSRSDYIMKRLSERDFGPRPLLTASWFDTYRLMAFEREIPVALPMTDCADDEFEGFLAGSVLATALTPL